MAGWESLRPVLRVVEVLEELEISYHVGGSLASSVHGVPRQTNDLDLVVNLPITAVAVLVHRLEDSFYIDEQMARSAIQRGSSFNLIHLSTGFKIDIFIQGCDPFDRIEFDRHSPHRLEGLSRDLLVKSAEDTMLRKLEWYRAGGEMSDRQWTDIVGLIRTQGDRLDRDYLRQWASELGVADLLDRVLETAG